MAYTKNFLEIDSHILWYLVGLITADGSLSKDGRHIDITLGDRQMLVEIIKRCGFRNKVSLKRGGTGTTTHRVQISNVGFYKFLISVGLTPNKSLSLEKLAVPREYFREFLRGVIDGDGSIRRWIHPSNRNEQWSLRIYSGAKDFIEWLRTEIEDSIGAKGRVHLNSGKGNPSRVYVLKFGKMAAREILQRCYQKNSFSLERKSRAASECFSSSTGWSRSKTISDLPG